MTDKQSDALRIADDLLDHYAWHPRIFQAAAELRRLQAENEDYGATIDYLTCENAEQIGEIVALKKQRDELLAALKLTKERFITKCEESLVTFNGKDVDTIEVIVDAIAKAGGAA